jgi:hypothetical protein
MQQSCEIRFCVYVFVGQRFQVPFNSGGEQNSPTGQILQEEEGSATKLEIVSVD